MASPAPSTRSPFRQPIDPRLGTLTAISIAALNLYAGAHGNPRRGVVPAIAESLIENTQYKPITANIGTHTGRPNEVLAGNHTLRAFRELADAYPTDPRWEEILVYWVDVDNDAAEKIVIVDNRSSELGTNDTATLAAILAQRPNLSGTGYTNEAAQKLIEALDPTNNIEDDEDNDTVLVTRTFQLTTNQAILVDRALKDARPDAHRGWRTRALIALCTQDTP